VAGNPYILGFGENCWQMLFLSKDYRRKTQNLVPKNPNLGEFRDNMEILSNYDLLCQTFAAVCRKIANFLARLLYQSTTPLAAID